MKTARTEIDVLSGYLTMEFDGDIVEFNIYDSMKYPVDDHSLCTIDVIEPIMQDVFEVDDEDELLSGHEKWSGK